MAKKAKWMALGLSVVACLATALVLFIALIPQPSRIQRTALIGADGQALTSLFDGLTPNPMYDISLVRLADSRRAHSRCGESLIAKLLGFVEARAYAQSEDDPCNVSDCGICDGSCETENDQPCDGPPNCTEGMYHYVSWTPPANSDWGEKQLCAQDCGCGVCGTAVCHLGPTTCINSKSCQTHGDCTSYGGYCGPDNCCDPPPVSSCPLTASCTGTDTSSCTGGSAGVAPCTNGCCTPPSIGCDPSQTPPCDCGSYCLALTFWMCNNCDAGGDPDICNPDTNPCSPPLRCVDGTCQDYADDDPILFDLGGGVQLTSARNGVNFTFFNKAKQAMTPWTVAGVHEAWLALDLNNDRRIDGGWELFSNAMSQDGPTAGWTGFSALAQFDKPAHGGNGDGVIDRNDRVFPYLLLWSDLNHNGISEPNELTSLGAAGVIRIDLKTVPAHYTDAYGNQIRNRAHIATEERGYGKDHWVYDVILAKTS